jgi:integrase
MAKRRGNREGSIYQRESDGRWTGSVMLGYDGQGKPRRKVVYGKTQAEASAKLLALRVAARDGTLTDSTRQTVAQALVKWIEGCVARELKESTIVDYNAIVRNHINPNIGGVQLLKLTHTHIEELLLTMARAGASMRVREKVWVVLRAALADAHRRDIVPKNACIRVPKPRPAKKKVTPLTEAQIEKLLAVAVGDRLRTLYVLAVFTGLRQGELFALQWSNIDLDNERLNVEHSLSELSGRLKLSTPKSEQSTRTVSLPGVAIMALRDHKARMEAEGQSGPWVFPDTEGGPLRKSNFLRRSFQPLLERAGIPPTRFHNLRHTNASLNIKAGAHAKVLQSILGHSQIAITMDIYGHLMPGAGEEAAAKLGGLFPTLER